MRNGYQDPDSDKPDGGTLEKTKINNYLSLDELGNHFGVRLNVTPFQVKTDANIVDGDKENQYTIGKANWVQLFVAGSISENVSIFIEIENDGKAMHYSWYHLGFHNIGGTTLGNVFIGNISALDFASYSNRLRQIGAIKGEIFGIKSSGGGAPDDATNISGARPGVMWYGYQGPVVAWSGISSGSNATDNNGLYHYWAGLKLEIPESMESTFEGSGITAWYYRGEDATTTATDQIKNSFTRLAFEGNLRFSGFDVQGAFVMVTEDNYYLTAVEEEEKYNGISAVAGKNIGMWYPALQFDTVTYDNDTLGDKKDRIFITPSVSYFLKENIRLGLHAKIDASNEDGGYDRSNDVQLNVRIMF